MADWVARAGSAPAFVGESAVAVIPGSTDALAAIARFDAATLPMTLGEALDLVLEGGPISTAPPFFIAVRDDDQWRCAVRGAITVRFGADEEISGENASTWLEFAVRDDLSLEVEVREAGPVSWLPVGEGPSRIGALRRGLEAAPNPAPVPAARARAEAPVARESAASSAPPAPSQAPVPASPATAPALASASDTIAGSPPEAPSRYDDLFGDLTVAGGVAAAAVLESASLDLEASHQTDTASGFDHSDVAVSAILCPKQHPNPPERGQCWRCATTLDSRSVVRVARPALGSVSLDDGRVIEIDRTVLLGRNPRAERTDAAHLPALVSVGSEAPGVSRTHARIFLDGWQVLVEDLGSTFGSTLIGADGATRRLRPGQPELVNGDSVLDLGGGSRVRLLGVP